MKFTTTLFQVSQTCMVYNHHFHKTSLKRGLGGQICQSRVNHDLGVFLAVDAKADLQIQRANTRFKR